MPRHMPTIAIPIGSPSSTSRYGPAEGREESAIRDGEVDQPQRHADPHHDRADGHHQHEQQGSGRPGRAKHLGDSMFPQFAATIAGVYREFAPPLDLAAHVACVWTSVSRGGAIFPDGCVDIVWQGDRLVVAGPATGPVPSPLPVGTRVFGVRFRLGVAGAALGLPAGEFADETVPLAELWGRRWMSGWPPAGRRRSSKRCASECSACPLDPLARAAALRMARAGRARLGARPRRQRATVAAALRGRRRLRAQDVGAGACGSSGSWSSRRGTGTWRGWLSRRATPIRRT